MASAELHIKDAYYFDVPKALWISKRKSKADFPSVWVKNDPQFQEWELDRLLEKLSERDAAKSMNMPPAAELRESYLHWKHADHANAGKPFDVHLQEQVDALQAGYQEWLKTAGEAAKSTTFSEWLGQPAQSSKPGLWFAKAQEAADWSSWWSSTCATAGDVAAFQKSDIEWSEATLAKYNYHLSGKILIPQPFGELRNLYQRESGFCVSKFMLLELVVFGVLALVFSRLGRRIQSGEPPRGRLVNLFETFVLFIRDEIARKAIHSHAHHDEHGDGHGHDAHGHDAHGDAGGQHQAQGAAAHAKHGHDAHGHDNPHADADQFLPVLGTLFFFILGCNLMGMIPWMGSPTGSWGATFALACVTFLTGLIIGSIRFGLWGYWYNQIPSMDLPFVLAILLKPPIFLVEVMGLLIKHTVLSIRLLANMVAGHLVLMAILMIAVNAANLPTSTWGVTAFFAVLGSTALSCLELFVAFLQAYVFTLLSALFINAAINKH